MRRKEGGIIWHTQGSGKSIVMVFLTKWILENNPNARIVIVTDIDADIAALETKLLKTQQIKQGKMQNLLTGRIRLI